MEQKLKTQLGEYEALAAKLGDKDEGLRKACERVRALWASDTPEAEKLKKVRAALKKIEGIIKNNKEKLGLETQKPEKKLETPETSEKKLETPEKKLEKPETPEKKPEQTADGASLEAKKKELKSKMDKLVETMKANKMMKDFWGKIEPEVNKMHEKLNSAKTIADLKAIEEEVANYEKMLAELAAGQQPE